MMPDNDGIKREGKKPPRPPCRAIFQASFEFTLIFEKLWGLGYKERNLKKALEKCLFDIFHRFRKSTIKITKDTPIQSIIF